MDYGISLAAYVRRRRLTRAVREIRDGSTAEDAAHKYQFSGVAAMSKAFRKEFGCSMKQALTEGDFAGQTFPCPEYNREQVLVSIAEIPELYMVGRPVEIGGAEASERLDRAAWWIDHSLPEFSEEEKQQIGAYQRDVIAMWYHPEELPEIVYLVGPVVQPCRAAGPLPEGLIEVHIPKQRYAVFQVRRRVKAPGRQPEMAEDIRHLCKLFFRSALRSGRLIQVKVSVIMDGVDKIRIRTNYLNGCIRIHRDVFPVIPFAFLHLLSVVIRFSSRLAGQRRTDMSITRDVPLPCPGIHIHIKLFLSSQFCTVTIYTI